MDQFPELPKDPIEEYSTPQRRLNWVDLTIALAGIVILYLAVTLLTWGFAKIWAHEKALIYFNGIITQLSFAALIIIILKVRRWSWSDLGFKKYEGKVWPIVLGVYGLTMGFNMLYSIYLLAHGITPPDTDVYSKLMEQTTWVTYTLNLIITVGMAPIVEETVFRGIIFGSLKTYLGKWTAAGISSIIFSALHLQLYGFLPRFALGIALVYLYNRYESLYPAIMMHALNNFVAITLAAMISH